MNKKQKKIIAIVAAVTAVVIGIIIAVVMVNRGAEEIVEVEATPEPARRRVRTPFNIVDIDQRPVVRLEPFMGNGRNLRVVLENLPLGADEAEYEIEYTITGASARTAGGATTRVPENEATEGLQGFIGELDVTSFPSITEKMLGSCSAGGACVHHNGITQGKVSLMFYGDENYAVQSVFTYFEEGDIENTTIDGMFTIAAAGLANAQEFLVMELMGLPAGLPGIVVTRDDDVNANATKAIAYGVWFNSRPTAIDVVTVTFEDIGDATGLAIWDGEEWTVVEDVEINGNTLTAEVPLAEMFVLIK
ncbi:MAG: hypothetical protein LBG64_02360 [Pseudomonadales bacterium]|jgi:hypothetical protein|nr:hypothetical protein [Pseudomonadales bacterium]